MKSLQYVCLPYNADSEVENKSSVMTLAFEVESRKAVKLVAGLPNIRNSVCVYTYTSNKIIACAPKDPPAK